MAKVAMAPRAPAPRRAATSAATSSLDAAARLLSADGYAHVRLGGGASLLEMESAARQLMGLQPRGGGSYNGSGGVTRDVIEGSSFLNGSAGAPSELPVQFHNEMAYSSSVPTHLAFAMVTQAGEGGTTLLADNVEVTRMLSPEMKQRLKKLGVRYVRNLHDEKARGSPHFFMSWQGAFQTTELAEAMRKGNSDASVLRRHADGERMQHLSWSSVFHEHPEHGELYFSSILNRHGSWLDGHHVFGQMPLRERPYHCLWGDGAEFSPREMEELRAVHEQCTIHVRLDKGDVIVMDNLRVAHGRTDFVGDRLIGLLLSDMIKRDLKPPPEFTAM